MTNSHQHRRPTKPQLKYLRDLAMETGQSFSAETFDQAREEIDRLKKAKPTSRADRRRETQAIRRDMARGRGGAAAVRDDELSGYGSTAAWGAE
jgi:hypothetical protein